jgi:ABC-2 type transport system permease protein
MATPTAPAPTRHLVVPASMQQVPKLTLYQLREYLRSRRFVALLLIILAIGGIITAVVAHFRGGIVGSTDAFYGSLWGGGVDIVIVLSAVFFGGDAIAGEFQNKTGYFLMGLPIRRTTVYLGKFIAAYLASVAMLLVFLAVLLLNGGYYFGGGLFPWQLGLSFVLALVYLAAVLGATFLFSSLFKTSAYGFVLTAILFLFGFAILQEVLTALVHMEPYLVISYAEATIGNVFSSTANWGFTGSQVTTTIPIGRGQTMTSTSWTPGIGEGIVIMLAYFVITAFAGLFLFEREEFT